MGLISGPLLIFDITELLLYMCFLHRTGILSEIFPTPTGPPAAHFKKDPLAEFCTWYPPVWGPNPEQNNRIMEVPVLSLAYQKIYSLFHQSMSETKVEILSIWQIHNVLHWDKFQR